MSALKGDYIGFSLTQIENNVERTYHSSDLGIVRVSSSDRYTQNLTPTISDKTIQVPGGDGTFLFGTQYTQAQIHIDFAFDSLTDKQIRDLTQILAWKKPQKLIFDENPYKYYWVKPNNPPQIKYLTFDEMDSNDNLMRMNKGEGTIDFMAYKPFAYSVHKYLDEYTDSNKSQWAAASGLEPSQSYTDKYGTLHDYDTFIDIAGAETPSSQSELFNGGDIEADFNLEIEFHESEVIKYYLTEIYYINRDGQYIEQPIGTEYIETENYYRRIEGGDPEYVIVVPEEISKVAQLVVVGRIEEASLFIDAANQLNLKKLYCKNDLDKKVVINTSTNLLEGFDEDNKKTGTLYNDSIESGFFFKIPKGRSTISVVGVEKQYLDINYRYLYY